MKRSTSGGAASGLVYSTDGGRMCPACRQPLARCTCRATGAAPVSRDGVVRVGRESKGRGGKTVTVVRGVPLAGDALAQLGQQLRAACGAGGTVKDGVIEVQGDHVERVMAWLAPRGWTLRRTGG